MNTEISSKLSVILPVYNERDNLEYLIPQLVELCLKHTTQFEVLVVDDDSSDNTDELIKKLRASVFFDTELQSILAANKTERIFIAGESTSGCIRASVIDGFSLGYQVCVVEDCVFDQNRVSHAINLYDIQHKYGQVTELSKLEP